MKRALVIRYGAIGDMIVITPALKRLKEMGYYVILNTSSRGLDVLKNNPNVDEFIPHDESIPISKVVEHWEKLKKKIPHNLFINFSESIECSIALHPRNPLYIYPKVDRIAKCNVNYYDATEQWAKLESCKKIPELYFTSEEETAVKKYIKEDKYNILWCLSGSGSNKVYPWTDYVMGECIKIFKDIHFITVGSERCQILEDISEEFPKDKVTQLAGRIPVRESLLLTKFVDLVISPDTGVLHAAGCYDTPKIGLLGHTTKENITKYFKNDYSIESTAECSPCMRLIYEYEVQCPLDWVSKAAYCMHCIEPTTLFGRISKVREECRKQK
jgi:ADP-heptose:LPS heptosyltransferase